ncbi:MAG: 50S ribosomal protein L4 [Chloroflexi bacterium]|nr:50S ribosomal protein L4 [Chloroflexota bacterium]
MELPVKNMEGQAVGAVEVADSLFGVAMRPALVHQVMVAMLANQRQGTHSTKTRSEVRGGGRKPWRQKGTGRARQGSIRSPQWRKGGVVFGPHPRDYRQGLPKVMRRLAIRCLLSDKVREGRLILVDRLVLAEASTKAMAGVLKGLGVKDKTLVVTRDPAEAIILGARNLRGVKTMVAHTLNGLDLLNHDQLVLDVEALRRLEELWAGELRRKRGVRESAAEATA